jgi:TRAP-type mannitol/chloroaromatic compound transport system permease large subunit
MTTLMLVILALWFVLLFTGAPIYALMALAGAAFIAAAGINPIAVPQKLLKAADSFPLLAAPMYILMGSLMNTSGVTERIFRFATVCVGWWKGGLCHANILGSVIFAGMSGSAVADAGGIGTIEIKAMQDAGYDRRVCHHRADHPAVAADDHLRRVGRGVDWRPVPGRCGAWLADGGGADDHGAGHCASP